ncbi:MAG: hypothetical protein ONB46_15340 [candidate division KSB1 bacterium]|nr:hypothetical protein [candidate division KSB1 bacterium]MDZ7367092.1 hypothetical protein [candidate division KSB1 bacterium]MDZ7405070.1 hypothetical protein [candidate division KSB1 bacterium]
MRDMHALDLFFQPLRLVIHKIKIRFFIETLSGARAGQRHGFDAGKPAEFFRDIFKEF